MLRLCGVPGCSLTVKARNVCASHYDAALVRPESENGQAAMLVITEPRDVNFWVCDCPDPLPAPTGAPHEQCGRCARPNYDSETIARHLPSTTKGLLL